MNFGNFGISENRNNNYRLVIIVFSAVCLFGFFWMFSRYPQLLSKAQHIGQALPSMSYSSEFLPVTSDLPIWQKILYSAVNWLDGMKIGMSFGVLFGALLHTYLKYFPLKIGENVFLNSLKGAIVGIPMGVCANCAVPVACGLTRQKGRVEVALGFLFSSPNFNPVVIWMTFLALPLAMSLTKYAILLAIILLVVPIVLLLVEKFRPIGNLPQTLETEVCEIPIISDDEDFAQIFKGLIIEFGKNIWMLLKPTISIMLFSALLASAMLILIPWEAILSESNPLILLLVSFLAVITPVPIALDVMFASQLQNQGANTGFVMLFLMTLGSYSIVPLIYLWRDISRMLSVSLFVFFVLLGWVLGLLF